MPIPPRALLRRVALSPLAPTPEPGKDGRSRSLDVAKAFVAPEATSFFNPREDKCVAASKGTIDTGGVTS